MILGKWNEEEKEEKKGGGKEKKVWIIVKPLDYFGSSPSDFDFDH
jgi:hypothetical protein